MLFTHYKNLLGSLDRPNIPFDLTDRIGPKLTDTLSILDDNITDEEIKDAVFRLPKGKASGPDGLPTEFFQNYWEVVGSDVIKMIRAF